MANAGTVTITLDANTARLVKGIKQSNRQLSSLQRSVRSAKKSLGQMATVVAGGLGMYGLHRALNAVEEDFKTLETAALGISKTTGLTGDSLKLLTHELDQMSLTMNGFEIKGLYDIAAAAGQLGITGTENIATFTKEMQYMASSSTLTAESAALGFAQLANVLHVPIREVGRLTGAMTGLAATTTATEQDLVNFTQRLAGAGTTLGLQNADIIGLGATLKDVGVDFEVGGTAVSKMMMMMLTDTEKFALVSGISAKRFAQTVQDHPIAAIKDLLSSIHDMDKTSRINALKYLGLDSARSAGAILKLSSNVAKLNTNLATSATQYAAANATQLEYLAASDSLAQAQTKADNASILFSVTIGEYLKPIMMDFTDSSTLALRGLTKFFGTDGPGASEVFGQAIVDMSNFGIGGMAALAKAINGVIGLLSTTWGGLQKLYGAAGGFMFGQGKQDSLRKQIAKLKEIQKSGDYGWFSNNNATVVRKNIKELEASLQRAITLEEHFNDVRKGGDIAVESAAKTTAMFNDLIDKTSRTLKLKNYHLKEHTQATIDDTTASLQMIHALKDIGTIVPTRDMPTRTFVAPAKPESGTAAREAKRLARQEAQARIDAHQEANQAILKDAQGLADDIAGTFKSALSQIFHGDIAGGIESLFKSLGDKMMEPALDAMSTSMASKYIGTFGTPIQKVFADNVALGVSAGMSAGMAGDTAKTALSSTFTKGAKGLKSDVVSWFNQFKAYAAQHGESVRIAPQGGFRTAAQQNAIYQRNDATHWFTSKDGYIKKSVHQLGRAIDIISTAGYQANKANTHIANLMRQFAKTNPQAGTTRFLSMAKDPNHVEINRQLGSSGTAIAANFNKTVKPTGNLMGKDFKKQIDLSGAAGGSCGAGGASGGLLGGIAMNFMGTLLGGMLNSLFHQTLSPEEIEAAKGQREFRGQDLRSLASAYKDAQYPLLQANIDIRTNTQKMANAFDVVAREMSALFTGVASGTGGIDPTGANFMPRHAKVLFGLFEQTSELLSSGFKLEIDNFVDGFNEIQTYWSEKVNTSVFFGLFTMESIEEGFDDVDPKVAKAFNVALQSGLDTILDSAAVLGFDKNKVEAALKKANLDIGKDGKIDTKGMSQEEASKAVSRAFSDMFSGAIEQVGNLDKFVSQYTEGMEDELETLVKITAATVNVTANMNMIGKHIGKAREAIDMAVGAGDGDIKEGTKKLQTGFKDYFQNFMSATDQYSALFDNTSEQLGNISGVSGLTKGMNAEEMRQWYKAQLDGFDMSTKAGAEAAGQFVTMAGNVNDLAKSVEAFEKAANATKLSLIQISEIGISGAVNNLILGAGGESNLQSGLNSYMNNFMTEGEKSIVLYKDLSRKMKEIGITMPKGLDTKHLEAWYKAQVKNNALTDKTKGTLITYSDAVKQYADALEKAGKSTSETLKQIADAWSGDLSYLNSFEKKLKMKELKYKADTATDYLSMYRKEVEYSKKVSTTRSDYAVKFNRYIDKVANQNDASIKDVVKELKEMRKDLDTLKKATEHNNNTQQFDKLIDIEKRSLDQLENGRIAV